MTTMLDRRKKRRHSATPAARQEFRQFKISGLELREAQVNGQDAILITGSPIIYNTPYSVWDFAGEFEETMLPGVASDLIGSCDTRFLFNHQGMPLARTISGTLDLIDTEEALTFQAALDPRQQLANDLAVAIERGDVSQMSCGFIVARDTWTPDFMQRSISKFEDLSDVSAVTYPASPTTSIELALRSMMAAPIESRARIRVAWKAAHEAREGKVLSTENAGLLQAALEALHEADDVDIPAIVTSLQTIDAALDKGQAGISELLGKANPDGGPDDLEPELEPADETTEAGGQDGTDATTPDTMQDATGWRSAPATKDERRAAVGSFNDIESAVDDAIRAKYGPLINDDPSDYCDLWLCDCGPDWAVFECWENVPGAGTWQVSYTRDSDGVITLGSDETKVIRQTTWEPVPDERSRNIALELELEMLKLRGQRAA